ncbi:Ribonuclease P protein component 3 [ANME-1 cluster archaeon GoMg1]|nr:Ribonuclease P protein component 3 [ANME-1 cluster archaeon GoMg1]
MPTFKFFDLNVHAYPETEVPVEELIRVARRYGYAGIAITNYDEVVKGKEGGQLPPSIANFAFRGIEIRAKSLSELKRRIRLYYGKVPLIVVRGGSKELNEAALKNPMVDVLAPPYGEHGKEGLTHVLVRYAAENDVAIEFNLNAIIHSRRSDRARILGKMRDILKFVRKYKAMPVITSNAHSIYDLRAPREMVALASLFGMQKEEAVHALSDIPEGILEKKWKKKREVEII